MNDHLVYVDDRPHGELHLSLERRRPHGAMPRIGRLALGAQVFPDFERGDSLPDDLSRDASSWRLEVPSVDHVLEALPGLDVLAVQASDDGLALRRAHGLNTAGLARSPEPR